MLHAGPSRVEWGNGVGMVEAVGMATGSEGRAVASCGTTSRIVECASGGRQSSVAGGVPAPDACVWHHDRLVSFHAGAGKELRNR